MGRLYVLGFYKTESWLLDIDIRLWNKKNAELFAIPKNVKLFLFTVTHDFILLCPPFLYQSCCCTTAGKEWHYSSQMSHVIPVLRMH